MKILGIITFVILFSSCKTSDSKIYKEYIRITNVDICDKVVFFAKNFNTKRKQQNSYEAFMKIIIDIERETGIISNTKKGFEGIRYLSNSDIEADINKWKRQCKLLEP